MTYITVAYNWIGVNTTMNSNESKFRVSETLQCSYLYFLLSAAVGPLLLVVFAYGKVKGKHSKIAPNAFMGKLYSKIVLNNGRK